jgi:poly(U)-binding-splicing factor PUF60
LFVLDNGQSANQNEKKFTLQDVPRLPRELTPFAPFTNVPELDQRGPLFQGPGAKRDTGRYKVRSSDDDNVKRAKKFAMEQSVKYVLVRQQQQQQRQQLDIIKKQQALLLMCRTYIGSINFELNEAALKQHFQVFGPVKAVSLTFDPVTNRHKGFAFLEFETPEAAQLSIEQMNGVILGGRNIKVGRPSNMPQAQPIIDQLTEEAKNYNRIYVASIHPDLTESDIQSVFEAFGKIKSCSLAKDTATGKHKGYGFIEYDTVRAAQDAINSMNLFDLGGQHLRVGKAITPPEGLFASAQPVASQMPTAAALAAATITAQLQAKDIETNSQATVVASQMINNPLTQVGYLGGTIAPTTVAAALSAASYGGASAVTSMISTMLNPTSALPNVIPQPSMIGSSGILSNFPTPPVNSSPVQQMPVQPPPPPQVIIPPPPVSLSIPQPTILEEPPIPVGLKVDLQSTQQQQYPSIALVIPTNKSDSNGNQKTTTDSKPSEDASATLSQQEELSIKGREQRHLLMQKLSQHRFDSHVCVLRNMVGPEEVDDDLQHEITEECSKYGEVNKVVIYTERQGEDDNAEQIVKIFVEFRSSQEAEKTAESLNGRWFGGRMIKAELYDLSAYQAEDLSG